MYVPHYQRVPLADRETATDKLRMLGSAARQTFSRLRTLNTMELKELEQTNLRQAHLNRFLLLSGTATVLGLILLGQVVVIFNGRTNLDSGIRAFENNHPADAITQLSATLAANPSLPPALLYRGMAYAKTGDHSNALADFSHLLVLEPTNADALVGRACEYLQTGDFAKADADLTKALESKPDSRGAYRLRAAARLHLSQFSRAQSDCDKYLQVSKNAPADERINCLLTLSSARAAQGNVSGAIAACSEAISLSRSDASLYDKRALLYRDSGKLHEALADCSKAIKLQPTKERLAFRQTCYQTPAHHSVRMQDLVADATDQKREVVRQPAETKPSVVPAQPASLPAASNANTSALTIKGYTLLRKGDSQHAAATLAAAVRANPQDLGSRRYLAYALLANGNAKEAAEEFAILSSSQDLLPADLLAYARALCRGGDTAKAISRYEDYLALRGNDADARLELIAVYRAAHRAHDANEAALEGIRRTHDDAIKQKFKAVL